MWRVMAVLASKGSQRQIDLADLTSIDASTLSRISPEVLKTIRRKFGVTHRVLDVLVAEPSL
jgi:hypothetical protein